MLAVIDEDWQAPFEKRMEAIGTVVVRTWRTDFEDRQAELAAEQNARKYTAAKAELQADWNGAKNQARNRVGKAEAALEATSKRIKGDIETFEASTKARVKQVASAAREAKARPEKRRDELKADRAARSAKLKQAWDLTKEALA